MKTMEQFDTISACYSFLKNLICHQGNLVDSFSERSIKKARVGHELLCVSFSVCMKRGLQSALKNSESLMYQIEGTTGKSMNSFTDRVKYVKSLVDDYIYDNKLNPYERENFQEVERMSAQKDVLADFLGNNTSTRQCFLSIWSREADIYFIGEKEIPCTIGYHFLIREGKLRVIVNMRSLNLDILPNDFYIAASLQNYFLEIINNHSIFLKSTEKLKAGTITFMVNNLHYFGK